MTSPLERKIDTLRRRVRWLHVAYGLCWVQAVVVGAAVVLGLADYAMNRIHFQDRGVQLICSLVLFGLLAWTVYRYLLRGLLLRLGDVELARRVERRFPRLEGRLASAVEFLKQPEDDPRAGSLTLRRAVIAQSTAEADTLDMKDAIQFRPVVRAAAASLLTWAVAGALVFTNPDPSRIALARLANPFGDTRWPQRNHLEVRDPVDWVAKGEAFEVEVYDPDPDVELPEDIEILYRPETDEGPGEIESEAMTIANGVAVARRKPVLRPFWYRVRGGDDDTMPWRWVRVIEPPRIEQLAITLIPPEYTGWPEEPSEGHIRAWVGTLVEFDARANKPLQAATLCFQAGTAPPADEPSARQYRRSDLRIPAAIDDDGLRFHLRRDGPKPFVVEQSGRYWFELVEASEEGEAPINAPEVWQVEAKVDQAPTPSIEQPATDTRVTADAEVPLRVVVKDDLAIRRIVLRVTLPGGQEPKVYTLYEGPEKVEALPDDATAGSARSGQTRIVNYTLKLGELDLHPPAELVLYAVAEDYFPQSNQSNPRRLTVVTAREYEDQLGDRQRVVFDELSRALKIQRQARGQVSLVQNILTENGRLDPQCTEHLQGAELNQRQVRQILTDPDDGVPRRIEDLLTDLKNNRIDSPDIRRRMEGIAAGIRQLEDDHLPALAARLAAALRQAQVQLEAGGSPPPGPELVAGLDEAAQHQAAVIAALEDMLGELAKWDAFRHFYREVSQLLTDQEHLARRTDGVAQQTGGRDLRDLSPQHRADLNLAAAQQVDLALRLERIQQEMEQGLDELRKEDPLPAETVSDALYRVGELATSARMRQAGADIQANRVYDARAGQKRIIEDLREILDILANRREHELSRLVGKLREAEGELADILRLQKESKDLADEAAATPDEARRRRLLEELSRRQKELGERSRRLSRRLERLQAEKSGKTTSEAAGKMDDAASAATGGDAEAAARHAEQARRKLLDAIKEVARRRLQAEAERAAEQIARLEDSVRKIVNLQKQLRQETGDLEGEIRGRPTDEQATRAGDVARRQGECAEQTRRLADDQASNEVFQLAFTGAADDMTRAWALLQDRQTGPATQQAQQNAIDRLEMVLTAIEPENLQNLPPEPKSPESPEGQQNVPGGVQTLAALKLLRQMQEEVNRRTRDLHAAVGFSGASPELQREYADLSRQQQQLSDLARRLLAPDNAAPGGEAPPGPPDLNDLNDLNPAPSPGR